MNKHVASKSVPQPSLISPDVQHEAVWRSERWLQVRGHELRSCKLCGQTEGEHIESGVFSS